MRKEVWSMVMPIGFIRRLGKRNSICFLRPVEALDWLGFETLDFFTFFWEKWKIRSKKYGCRANEFDWGKTESSERWSSYRVVFSFYFECFNLFPVHNFQRLISIWSTLNTESQVSLYSKRTKKRYEYIDWNWWLQFIWQKLNLRKREIWN